ESKKKCVQGNRDCTLILRKEMFHKNYPPLLLFNFIANTPDYFEISGIPGIDFDLFTDMTNMYCYRVVGTDGLFVPYLLVDLIDGKDFSGIFYQKQKNVILNG